MKTLFPLIFIALLASFSDASAKASSCTVTCKNGSCSAGDDARLEKQALVGSSLDPAIFRAFSDEQKIVLRARGFELAEPSQTEKVEGEIATKASCTCLNGDPICED